MFERTYSPTVFEVKSINLLGSESAPLFKRLVPKPAIGHEKLVESWAGTAPSSPFTCGWKTDTQYDPASYSAAVFYRRDEERRYQGAAQRLVRAARFGDA